MLAGERLVSVIGRHTVATSRTLEQKISDAGPPWQHIDPHRLTPARQRMVQNAELIEHRHANAPWYSLPETDPAALEQRLKEQVPIFERFGEQSVSSRVGQTLEIAVFRALHGQTELEPVGGFLDLADHDDSTLYSKEEPPSLLNRGNIGRRKLDFIVRHGEAKWAGIEVKNVRPWLYPHSNLVIPLLQKCITIDCIPVLIARRIHYATFHLLSTCGVVVHQPFNQLLPNSEATLAAQAANRLRLGYHDIRVGNEPDARLVLFIGTHLPQILPEARQKFERFRDLLSGYANSFYDYPEFVARIRRRLRGINEDSDWEDTEPEHQTTTILLMKTSKTIPINKVTQWPLSHQFRKHSAIIWQSVPPTAKKSPKLPMAS
jgi:hypothetical protein